MRPIILLDDDLLEVFEFIPRLVLAESLSLVNFRFNELAHSKMHICRKHSAKKIVIFGRHLRDDGAEWRECCLALGDLHKYKPYLLPLGNALPENIAGIQELLINHFSGPQLVHFLGQFVGHLLSGCNLEIRFLESLLVCGGTERAEFDEFMDKFYEKCNAISIYSYERHFKMPQFLLRPMIFAKVRLFQLTDSIPVEYLDLILHWIHTPFCRHDGQFEGKKLQFRTGNQELIDKLIENTRQRFNASASPIEFRVEFVYTGLEPTHQFEHNWNFVDQNDGTEEILALRSLFYPKMFELRRRGANEEENGRENGIANGGNGNGGKCCNILVTVFSQPHPLNLRKLKEAKIF